MSQVISICSWDRFQHYKDRDPPWVKLYRDMLTTESWVLGTDTSRLVQVASMLLAARYQNATPLNWPLLKKVAHLDCTENQFMEALDHLRATRFLEIHENQQVTNGSGGSAQDASNTLANCASQNVPVYSETEQSRGRAEAEQSTTASATPTRQLASRGTLVDDPEWMLEFKLVYPSRAGDQGWRKAVRAAHARIGEGHTTIEFVDGARRYAAYCQAIGKTGTEYVKQACTFLGPDKHFLEPWNLPATKAQIRQNGNIDAARQWLAESGDT